MQKAIFFFPICFAHVLLATNDIVSLWITVPIALSICLSTYKYIHIDFSWIIQVLLLFVYLFNGPGYENLLVLLCSTLLFIYSGSSQKSRAALLNSKVEVNAQLEQFNDTFQTVRKERHDYLKHVAAISYMLEKDDFHSAKNYMTNLIERYEETNLSIKGEQGAIAAVLHSKYKAARQKGIAMNYQLEVPISNIPIPLDELVELIGNMLENAVDACEEWQQKNNEQGYIELSLKKRSGLYILTCENSTLQLPHQIADHLFTKSGLTTKQQHEGLGTTIIQDIIHKHQGFLDFSNEKNNFSLVCKIPSVVNN